MRYAVITAATAAAVIGGGTAFGSAQQSNPGPGPSPSPKPSPLSAQQIRETLQQTCVRNREQTRKEHPAAVISECNYGEGTLTTPQMQPDDDSRRSRWSSRESSWRWL